MFQRKINPLKLPKILATVFIVVNNQDTPLPRLSYSVYLYNHSQTL